MKNDNSDGDGLLSVCVPDEVCAPVSSASVWESILHRAYSIAWSIEWKSCPDLFRVQSIEQW